MGSRISKSFVFSVLKLDTDSYSFLRISDPPLTGRLFLFPAIDCHVLLLHFILFILHEILRKGDSTRDSVDESNCIFFSDERVTVFNQLIHKLFVTHVLLDFFLLIVGQRFN